MVAGTAARARESSFAGHTVPGVPQTASGLVYCFRAETITAETTKKEEEMANAERRAHVVWEGDLPGGNGSVTADSSKVLEEVPVTWASRVERPDGKTSPEELIAAAHASCYSMAFSNVLAQKDAPPVRLEVEAVATFDADQVKITTVDLNVRGEVPGMSDEEFDAAAHEADQACPVSNALRNNVEIRLNTSLG
jgi:osmotically inducible protein OsmC